MFSLTIDEEIVLGLLEDRHAELLYRLADQNREHLGRWLPWAWEASVENQRAFILRALRQFAANDGFQAGIWYRGVLVGGAGLRYIDWPAGTTELGYWLDTRTEGKGVVTRVVRGLCRLLFEDHGLNRVEIRCDPANRRSCAVPERLGFKREGVLRQVGTNRGVLFDHVVYGLLADEWHRWEEGGS